MTIIKPTKIGRRENSSNKLNSAEIGKLWATYMGNSLSRLVIGYFLNHVEDQDVKLVLEHSYDLCNDFLSKTTEILNSVNHPIPIGFGKDDVNEGAPRLFEDEFYLHYLKYTAKSGLSIYSIAMPLIFRQDVRDFFDYVVKSTIKLTYQVNDLLLNKGFMKEPPFIQIAKRAELAKGENYLSGFFGEVRPLHALEIAHLYDNIETNHISKALLIGFSQVAKKQKVKEYFSKAINLTNKAINSYCKKMDEDYLPCSESLDHLVTDSTFSPFSDKLMVCHEASLFAMRMRAFGNSIAVNGRHDIALLYMKNFTGISFLSQEGASLMLENEWLEQVPQALDRDDLTKH